jgi:hypothetical protein
MSGSGGGSSSRSVDHSSGHILHNGCILAPETKEDKNISEEPYFTNFTAGMPCVQTEPQTD